MNNFLHTLVSRERPTQSAGERANRQATGLIAPRVASIFEANKRTQDGEIHRTNDDAISDQFAFDKNIVRDSYETQKWNPSTSDHASGNPNAGIDNSAFYSARVPGMAESVTKKLTSDENHRDTVSTLSQRAYGTNQSQASETVRIRSKATQSSDINQEPRYRANSEQHDQTITPLANAIATPLDSHFAQTADASIAPKIRNADAHEDAINTRQRQVANIMPPPQAAMMREDDFFRRGANLSLSTANAERIINITIGRVEVRATTANTTNFARTSPKANSAPRPMGLDEYLAARNKRG